MSQSVHFLANYAHNSEQILSKRLAEIANKLNTKGFSWPTVLYPIVNIGIKEIAVGSHHIAFLLQDGRVCRVGITVLADKVDSSRTGTEIKSYAQKGSGTVSSNQQPAAGQAPPTSGGATAAASGGGGGGASSSSSFNSKAAKIRRVMMARGRMARGVIVNSRPLIPASAVPEELIAQAQVVLQGKSREIIIRELQRTNLDVNQAVNNLLSRDDDDGDDFDDAADSYMPEDLISLLDTGLHGDQPSVIIDADALYSDDVWGYASIRRRVADKNAEKYAESASASKDQQSSNNNTGNSSNINKNLQSAAQNPIQLGNQLEFWTDKDGETAMKFERIGAMYSELIGLGIDGKLYQWKWSSAKSDNNLHPKFEKSGLKSLNNEKILSISCSIIRCTLLFPKNRLASFVDESLGPDVGLLLDSPCFDPPSTNDLGQSIDNTVVDVYSSHLVSCARTKSNVIFWWGIMPFNERRKSWEKNKSKSKKYLNYDTNEISVGAQVRMKANPLYQAGSIAFTTINGYPQLGILMESAWTLTETCRFQIKDASSIQLSSSKTGEKSTGESSTGGAVDSQSSARSRKRQASVAFKEDSQTQQQQQQPYKEEAWNLADVVFLEDNATTITGNVVKVDGPYCGVVFPDNDGKVITDPQKIIANCRLFRKEDLAVVSKSVGTINQKGPDVFQREPKQILLQQREKIIDMAITNSAILTLQSRQGKIIFTRSSFSGKTEEEHVLCPNAAGFLASGQQPQHKKLLNYGEEQILIVLDGNACIYPVSRDSASGLKQFSFNCLPRLSALGLGVYPVKNSNLSSKKNRITITTLVFAPTTLLEHITHCDLDSVKQFIVDLEQEKNIDKVLEEITDARLDNNQNILHACVSMAVPPNNKDNVDYNPNFPPSSGPGGGSGAGPGGSGPGGSGSSNTNTTNATMNEVSSLESAAASAARAVYEAKWEQMVSGNRSQISLDEIMQMAGRPVRWGDVSQPPPSHPSSASSSFPRFDILTIPPPSTSWPMEVAADTTIGSSSADSLLNPDVANIPMPYSTAASVTPSNSSTSGVNTASSGITATPRAVSDVKERQQNVHQIAKFLCEHPFLSPYLPDLLTAQDQDGLTPFLYAVNKRIYSMALLFWDTAKRLQTSDDANQYKDLLQNMLYPPGLANPDNSPLFLLCYNDTCSFTWTGDEHINQDIFECRTCGLVGTLCCCTECAFVCHKNHDCKLKRTSPTAYCDCWEKCKCQALIVGNQTHRLELFNRILNETDLVTKCNKRGEHALLFLVKTVGRQTTEQRQHRISRSRGPKNAEIDPDMPEHDLEPPRFARRALEKMLTNWSAVKSLLLTGCKEITRQAPIFDEEYALLSQDNVTHLDRFSYALIAKCPSDLLDIFLSTLIKEGAQNENSENQKAISRFVRSIVRIFSILNVCMTPTSNRKKSYSQPILRCRRVFQALITYSIKEIAAAADGLLAPVRLGFMKSTHHFTLVSSNLDACDIVEKLFATDPIFDTNRASFSASSNHRSLSSERMNQYGAMNNLASRDSIRDDDVVPDSQPSMGSSRGRRRNEDSASDQDGDSSSDSDYDDHDNNNHSSNIILGTPTQIVRSSMGSASGDFIDQHHHSSLLHTESSGSHRSPNNGAGPGSRHHDSAIGRGPGDLQPMGSGGSETAGNLSVHHGEGHVVSSVHVSNNMSQSAAASHRHPVGGGGAGRRSAAPADDLYYSDNESLESAESINQQDEGEGPSLVGGVTDDEAAGGPNQDDLLDYAVGGAGGDLGPEPVSDTDHHGDEDDDDDPEARSPVLGVRGRLHHPTDRRDRRHSSSDHHHHDRDSDRNRGDHEQDDESEISDSDDLDGDNTNESDMDHEQTISGHHQASERFSSVNSLAPPTLRWAMRRAIPREQLAAQNAAHLPPTPPVGGGAATAGGVPATSMTGQSDRNTGGLIFVDSSNASNRRAASYAQMTSAPVLEPSGGAGGSSSAGGLNANNTNNGNSLDNAYNINNGPSSLCTSSLLARLFGILVRQLADFLNLAYDYQRLAPSLPRLIHVTKEDAANLQALVDRYLKPSWDWLCTLLDSTESQLRFSSALISAKLGPLDDGSGDPEHSSSVGTISMAMVAAVVSSASTGSASAAFNRVFRGPGQEDHSNIFGNLTTQTTAAESTSKRAGSSSKTTASESESINSAARREFLQYALSLMRAHSDEHGDDLPNLELSSLRHVTYVLDAYLYYLMNSGNSVIQATNQNTLNRATSIMTSSMTSSSSTSRLYEYRTADYDADYGTCGDYFEGKSSSSLPFMDQEDSNSDELSNMDESHGFFKRSDSMIYPGLYPLKMPFEYTVGDSMPLVERPHLLQPDATIESYFGVKDEPKAWRKHQVLDKERGQNFSMHLGVSSNVLSVDKELSSGAGPSSSLGSSSSLSKLFTTSKESINSSPPPSSTSFLAVTTESSGQKTPTKSSSGSAEEMASEQQTNENSSKFSPASQNQRSRSVIVHASTVQKPKSTTENVSGLAKKSSRGPGIVATDAIFSQMADREMDDQQFSARSVALISQAHMLMSRWKLCLAVMARAFGDDVGQEPGSILIQLAGFSVKATRFRKEMERLRNSQGKDLILEVERERNVLLQTTIRQMNQFYGRRSPAGPPVPVHKVKVTFKDEPGEGSGVARAFYTAIADAFLADEKLPNLDSCQSTLATAPITATSTKMQQQLLNRLRTREREREIQRRRIGGGGVTGRRYQLSADAPPYFPHGEPISGSGTATSGTSTSSASGGTSTSGSSSSAAQQHIVVSAATTAGGSPVVAHVVNWDPSKQALGDRLLPKIRHIHPNLANKITGMLLDLQPHQLLMLLASDEALRLHVAEAYDILTLHNAANENLEQPSFEIISLPRTSRKSTTSTPSVQSGKTAAMILDPDELIDNQPLFFQPSGLGFYSPVPGKNSAERLNAFRNVGRVIGLCLLQNELLPLPLCRHVFKFILGRPINWYDLAFFDKQVFESLREMANQESASINKIDDDSSAAMEATPISDYCLTFCINLLPEEGGGTLELKKGGANISVTSENLVEYVYRYVDCRLIKLVQKPLEAIRDGVFDVLPQTALEGLTSEDLRLLLCGTPDINISVLQSYASFADESSASTDQLSKFKKWFWSVVRKMTPKEKQDLVYFWTGSPALPSSEEGFQPHPNVMIRPADDNHLPTANTCISRLYVPLYSSKQILRQKLLLAIKAKTFGFV